MSRVGKNPIALPKGAKVEVKGQHIKVEGPKGKLERNVAASIAVAVNGEQLVLTRKEETASARALHGTERALLANMVKGVTDGFTISQELVGVGYRATAKGQRKQVLVRPAQRVDLAR